MREEQDRVVKVLSSQSHVNKKSETAQAKVFDKSSVERKPPKKEAECTFNPKITQKGKKV